MPAIAKDTRKLIQIALPLLGALFALSVSKAPSQAATNHMLVIPASDGYGFDDCLSGGKACGQVIADAWCEAHGMAASVSFGRAEDITASLAETVWGSWGKDLPDKHAKKRPWRRTPSS